jgi:hypothetical protein
VAEPTEHESIVLFATLDGATLAAIALRRNKLHIFRRSTAERIGELSEGIGHG